jgi:hypothetical protein
MRPLYLSRVTLCLVADVKFVGSTPSTLNLSQGNHDILLMKPGYKDWSRSMMVGSGSVRTMADMLPNQAIA